MEKPKTVNYGSSKLVPSVQELAKQPMAIPPSRYIRSDQDPPIISSPTSVVIPVINMQNLLCGDNMDVELEKLHSGCRDFGFFQLVNHGVSTKLVDQLKHEIQEFFQLPFEEKKKFWQNENELEGFGQAFVMSDEQKLDWADLFFMTTSPLTARKPHLFPKLPQPFRETLDAYLTELKSLATRILEMMEKALKVEEKEITKLFDDGLQRIRMSYYPPCPQPEQVIGLTPHSDASGLTILLQVNETEGLQIRNKDKWIPIKPLPNAFIVNIGDILEIVTNGAYRSVEHRATVNKMKERLSIAMFSSPRIDAEIGPAESLVTDDAPPLFRRIIVRDYFKRFFGRELGGKSCIETMKIENGKGNAD